MHYSADIISTGKMSFENGQVQVLTSAINRIYGNFLNFAGFGQVISNKALSKKVWNHFGWEENLDRLCLGDISHKN